jgi:hypothetical protein
MSIPIESKITVHLLRLLNGSPSGTLHCREVYSQLAPAFPELTYAEKNKPYKHSKSFWANRIQWARHRCVLQGWIFSAKHSPEGRSYWTITDAGRRFIGRKTVLSCAPSDPTLLT